MLDFIGVSCPICKKKFKETDNVVVCPKCGAPYHKECYAEQGECKFYELHEKGEAWKEPEVPELKTANAYEIKDQECPSCGVLNAQSSLFCSNCGNALKMKPHVHTNQNYQQNPYSNSSTNNHSSNKYRPPVSGSFIGGTPPIFDPMGGVNPSDTMDENISFADASKLVQQSNNYYMPVFKKISATKKSKFNLSAFIFSGGWLIYRKQYKLGIFITIFMLLLYLSQTFCYFYVYAPLLIDKFSEIGIVITDSGVTFDQMMDIMPYLSELDMFLLSTPTIITATMFFVMLFTGLYGNKLYYKHTIRKINYLRNTSKNSEEFNLKINEAGGINTMASICVLICYLLCSYLPVFFFI